MRCFLLLCSGKFPPIPPHYSNDLKELVEALIKKEPEARPSLQEILDLAYVRRHMGLYRDHISRHITERQTSFQRSLSQFNLEAIVQVSIRRSSFILLKVVPLVKQMRASMSTPNCCCALLLQQGPTTAKSCACVLPIMPNVPDCAFRTTASGTQCKHIQQYFRTNCIASPCLQAT